MQVFWRQRNARYNNGVLGVYAVRPAETVIRQDHEISNTRSILKSANQFLTDRYFNKQLLANIFYVPIWIRTR